MYQIEHLLISVYIWCLLASEKLNGNVWEHTITSYVQQKSTPSTCNFNRETTMICTLSVLYLDANIFLVVNLAFRGWAISPALGAHFSCDCLPVVLVLYCFKEMQWPQQLLKENI